MTSVGYNVAGRSPIKSRVGAQGWGAGADDPQYLALGGTSGLHIWQFDGSGTFTRVFTDSATVGAVSGLSWYSNTHLAIIGDTFKVLKRTGSNFAFLSDPTPAPTGRVTCRFSLDGSILAAGGINGAASLQVYSRSGDTFTKLTDPVTTANLVSLAVNPTGTLIYCGENSFGTPVSQAFAIAAGVVTPVAAPVGAGDERGPSFSRNGNRLMLGSTWYSINGTAFTSLGAVPGGGASFGSDWGPNVTTKFVIQAFGTPAAASYSQSGTSLNALTAPSPAVGATLSAFSNNGGCSMSRDGDFAVFTGNGVAGTFVVLYAVSAGGVLTGVTQPLPAYPTLCRCSSFSR